MFMQAQQAQQQTNAILQHLVNISKPTTYPTYPPNNNVTTFSSNNNNYPVVDLFSGTTDGTTYTNNIQQQDDTTTYANNLQQQDVSIYENNTPTTDQTTTYELTQTDAVFSPPTVVVEEVTNTDGSKVVEVKEETTTAVDATPVPKRTTQRLSVVVVWTISSLNTIKQQKITTNLYILRISTVNYYY